MKKMMDCKTKTSSRIKSCHASRISCVLYCTHTFFEYFVGYRRAIPVLISSFFQSFMAQFITTALADNVLTIAFNRPDSYNALNSTLLGELHAELMSASANDEVRCIVLTGVGKAFSSGQDLKQNFKRLPNGAIDFKDVLVHGYNPVVRALQSIPKPIIAGINGVAAGAGMSLALCCDVRVMSTSARIVEGFSGIALVPDAGASLMLPKLMGYGKAFEFAALNGTISADKAREIGLVEHVYSAESFEQDLHAYAATYAAMPTATIGMIKTMFRSTSQMTLEQVLEQEAELQERAGSTADHLEGITAFIQKRAPVFQGK